ncbi:sugar kinase [Luteimicrobium album]|uniref:Sugar kinase n=1 Tax=Luteimicrobium album TaxID=1054550 RepID=A0ABQ6I154_9MICO|nr:sugar kinase [Luteimicrobium album]GMA23678.1 sugar kinase [Luteimicrobium album]
MSHVDLLVAGEALLALLAPGGTDPARSTVLHPHVVGAEVNAAAAVAALGHRVAWTGVVGHDSAGRRICEHLRGRGVDVGLVRTDPTHPTGLLVRDSTPTRPVQVDYHRAGSAATGWNIADASRAAGTCPRVLLISGITPMLSASTRAATAALVSACRDDGTTIVFDPNVRLTLGLPDRWRRVVRPLLRAAHVVLASERELELLTESSADRATDDLLAGDAHTVVVRSADATSRAVSATGTIRQDPFPVTAVDPVGAGDAFAGGYVSALLEGLAPAACLSRAAVLGALAVTVAGDQDACPDRDQLRVVEQAWSNGDLEAAR